MSETQPPRRTGRSVGAVLAGIVAGAALSLGTDEVLHIAGVYPPWGQPTGDHPLLLATIYRIVYGIVGCYLAARLAPYQPMAHALAVGAAGFAVSVLGAVATWNQDLGPHWYPVAVAAIALPCAWAGGKLRLMQLRARAAIATTSR